MINLRNTVFLITCLEEMSNKNAQRAISTKLEACFLNFLNMQNVYLSNLMIGINYSQTKELKKGE